jgi:putative mRNA 3-end processing factor
VTSAPRGGLGVAVDEAGARLGDAGPWLDPVRAVPLAFVSHVHAATAAAGSARVLASRETLLLAGALGVPTAGFEGLAWDEPVDLPWADGASARVTLAPAGHVLGAAQLVVEVGGRRLVYTGDWGPEGDATHGPGRVIVCDDLVVTTAFALPIFRFEPARRVIDALVAWCAERLAGGVTPVVLAGTPGPAQAVVAALLERRVPVSALDEVRRGWAAFATCGVAAATTELPLHEAGARGRAVVAPAAARASDVKVRGHAEVAYASPWALLDAAVEQKRADAAFVLSDQADHRALVGLVRASGARRVIATRGDARAFAHRLAKAGGVDASALELGAIDERGAS